jgi:hypothetical protein
MMPPPTKMMPPMLPISESRPTPMLQALVVRCDGVDYMFFGPPIAIPNEELGPTVQALSFGGLTPVQEMIELLQQAVTSANNGQHQTGSGVKRQ